MNINYKKYKSAFIVMKALPFTKGHKYLIDSAISLSDKVTVLVCSLIREPIPGELRFKWVRDTYKENNSVIVLHYTKEVPQYPEEHKDFWNIWTNIAKESCSDMDVLFTSELYGIPYSEHLNVKHEMVDLERKTVPISGTSARTNPFNNWDYIPDIVKPYFIKRVSIMGPESTGKSTLTKKLANNYLTNYVEEYGRTVYEENGNKIYLKDFIPISIERQKLEDSIIKESNKLIFCDTEDLTTWLFSKMYFPNEYEKIKEYFEDILLNKKKYDLYILLKPDCNFIQDGTRNFENNRWEHYNELKREMVNRNFNFVEIGGSWENRFIQSKKIIKKTFNI